jgi:ATP-dependent DNA helicase RecG
MTESSKVDLLIKEGEGFTVEFKERFTSRISEDMVAFANSRGGTILLGVRDDHVVVGEKLSNALKAQIISLGRNCTPSISVSAKQAGAVIAVSVPEGTEKPYSCSAGYFRRLDAVTQKMSNHELRLMFHTFGGVPFEERICAHAGIGALSKEKIRAFMKSAGIGGRNIPIDGFLKSLRLVQKDGITNAAVLLFGKEPWRFLHNCELICVRFSDSVGVDIFDRVDCRDGLITQFDTAMFFLKKHLNHRSIIQGTYRREAYDVPEEAFREAIANAVIHRDYSVQGTSLMVKVFDDRLEIINPGGLPDGLNSKDFGSVSIRRNELLCDMFHRLDLVERAGTGIKRMRDAMKIENLPPPSINADAFFILQLQRLQPGPSSVAIPGESREEGSEKSSEKGSEKSSEKILELMKQKPIISIAEMAEQIGKTTRAVEKQIALLKEKGKIRRVGPDRGGQWEVF